MARRIVSLLPSATEIVFALGAGDALVGVTHECDFPPEARAKPHLTRSTLEPALSSGQIDRHVRANLHAGSSLYALDAALLEALAPDLIITQELCEVCAVSYDIVARAAKALRTDPRIISLEPSSLADLYANVIAIGERTGTQAAAAALVDTLQARAAALARHVAGRSRPRVLVLEWTDPLMNGGHWTPELVALAGGEPVLANPGANSQRIAWPDVVDARAEVIIVAPCGYDLDATLRAIDELEGQKDWTSLEAVRAGRVYAVDGNAYVNRPGPRLIDTAELFASALFDEPYGAAHGDLRALRKVAKPRLSPIAGL